KNFVNAPSISQVTPVNADADYEDDPCEKEIEEALGEKFRRIHCQVLIILMMMPPIPMIDSNHPIHILGISASAIVGDLQTRRRGILTMKDSTVFDDEFNSMESLVQRLHQGLLCKTSLSDEGGYWDRRFVKDRVEFDDSPDSKKARIKKLY
ncbi:9570_t:CDS:2, partial [Funneliformis caledonium]